MVDNKSRYFNDLAICYVNMINLSFERIPILESSRKRGLPPELCTNKGKFENRLSACDAQVGRFSFYNLDEPVRYLSPFWFWLVQVGVLLINQ
jgi:hypothetical protein